MFGLLRLFIVAALIYFLFVLVRSILEDKNKEKQEKSQNRDKPQSTDFTDDVLVEDPVCHKLVPKKQALRCKYGDEIVYFCSEKCCETYEQEQEK